MAWDGDLIRYPRASQGHLSVLCHRAPEPVRFGACSVAGGYNQMSDIAPRAESWVGVSPIFFMLDLVQQSSLSRPIKTLQGEHRNMVMLPTLGNIPMVCSATTTISSAWPLQQNH